MSQQPECPDFSESVRRFQAFLRREGWPDRILWIREEGVTRVPGQPIAVVRPADGDGSAEAEAAHEIGRHRNLGVSMQAICTLGDATCATVSYPSDEREAELLMYPSDGSLKLSAALPRTEGTAGAEATSLADPLPGLSESRRKSRWSWLPPVFGSLILVVAMYAIVRELVVTIRAGDGGKLYQTGWGYKSSAYAALGAGIALVGSTLVGLVIAWIGRREERDLLRRYGHRKATDHRSSGPDRPTPQD